MELCYIWIKNFKNIQEQGFTFSGQFSFSLDKESSSLIIKRNPSYQFDFFDSENRGAKEGYISSVTAIIGENGSGKSNLIEFFCRTLIQGSSFIPRYKVIDDILVFYVPERFIIIHEEQLKLYEYTQIPDELTIDLKSPQKQYTIDDVTHVSRLFVAIVYSTNWADNNLTSLNSQLWEFINISDNYNYYKSHFPPIKDDFERDNQYVGIDFLGRHISEDTKRQIFFLKDYLPLLKKEFKFKVLDFVSISILQKYTNEVPQFKELFAFLFNFYKPSDDFAFSIMFYSAAALYNYVYPLNNSDIDKESHFNNLKKCVQNSPNSLNAYKEFLGAHPLNVKPKKVAFQGEEFIMDRFKVPETIEYLEFIDNNFNSEHLSFSQNESPLESYSRNKSFNPIDYQIDYSRITDFLDKYLNHIGREIAKDYISIEPLNYSTGELAFLNICSRIRDSAITISKTFDKHPLAHHTKTSSIMLILDEGETYLHPQWQKKLLKFLLEYLPTLFKRKAIQVILTSHSPLFISDLPKENIVFLKRQDGRSIIADMSEHSETFAANIHTLYSDSFFIQDGLMGEFAKDKISYIAQRLTSPEKLSDADALSITKTIDIIGEPLIKQKLQELYYKKTRKNEQLNERIERLRNELKEAEDEQNGNKNKEGETNQ